MTEAVLNAFGEQLKDLTLCKTRYDLGTYNGIRRDRSGEEPA